MQQISTPTPRIFARARSTSLARMELHRRLTATRTTVRPPSRVRIIPTTRSVTAVEFTTRSQASTTSTPATTARKTAASKRAACFTAGTKIHTKDGFKAIESIKAGDYVCSENPETHEKALKKVKKIFVREEDSVVRLSINGEAIETTNEHPFYVEGHGWSNASDLKAGELYILEW